MSKKPLQRWDFNYGGHMERDEAGEYVEYYDYAELAVAKQEIERQKRYDVNSQRLLMAAADNLVREIERNECHHEDTKRGGAQWTICLQCDSSWADDEGGVPVYNKKKCIKEYHELVQKLDVSGELYSAADEFAELLVLQKDEAERGSDYMMGLYNGMLMIICGIDGTDYRPMKREEERSLREVKGVTFDPERETYQWGYNGQHYLTASVIVPKHFGTFFSDDDHAEILTLRKDPYKPFTTVRAKVSVRVQAVVHSYGCTIVDPTHFTEAVDDILKITKAES